MKKYIPWLGAAIIITILFSTIFEVAQQSLRLSANDPQIQTAQDVASQLNNGATLPTSKVGDINIATGLDTVTTVYTKSGSSVYSTGELNGKAPTIAKTLLTAANSKAYSVVTLDPTSSLHQAAAIVSAKNYYVVSARSLSQVDSRESTLLHITGYGWTASIVVLVLIYGLPFAGRGQSVAANAAYNAPKTRSHSGK